MRPITSDDELRMIQENEQGFIYNDFSKKAPAGGDFNILHRSSCHQTLRSNTNVTKYFFDDLDEASTWLATNRGREGMKWRRCRTCFSEQTLLAQQAAFEVGRLYRRVELHTQYGGQRQGGISTPTAHPFLMLFTGTSGEAHGYQDGWDGDVYRYFGEGQRGDMTFVRGNAAIRDHAKNGKTLHLFQTRKKGHAVRYLGEFTCASWETTPAPDTEGQMRRAIVFHLMQAHLASPVPADQALGIADTADLRRKALEATAGVMEGPASEARRRIYRRSAFVRAYVLARSSGICEACGEPAPFNRPDGMPYLEPHHTQMISEGGPDHPRWVGAICPNCHAQIHYGENGDELNQRLAKLVAGRESD